MTENRSDKILSGDKLSSYGGNLTLHQDGEGSGESVKSSSAILTGNRVSLHYIRDTGTSISLAEKDWVRIDNGAPVPATREDMLRVLSDIQVSILPYNSKPTQSKCKAETKSSDLTRK